MSGLISGIASREHLDKILSDLEIKGFGIQLEKFYNWNYPIAETQ